MSIGGQKRENTGQDFGKKVGLFEAEVITINPTIQEYESKLGITLKEGSKQCNYISESKDGNTTLRVDIWLREVDDKKEDNELFRNKVSFFLEDKERENKDGTKNQYINSVGNCSWVSDPNDLQDWFTENREFRVAYVGEEDLYNFLRTWLCELDYRHAETTLMQDWKKLMKGNVKDLEDQINGEWCGNVVCMATVSTKEKDNEVKEYQGIYNKSFLPAYTLKQFRLVDYNKSSVVDSLSSKKSRDLKPHERFVLNLTGEYGCKDYYIFSDIEDYNSGDNLVASNDAIDDEDADY